MAPQTRKADSSVDDLTRAAEQIAGRLRTRGIDVDGRESPDDLVRIEEAVEHFEAAVEARGGDLMVDEGPRGVTAEPDDVHFALPLRDQNESAASYIDRLARATEGVRLHGRID